MLNRTFGLALQHHTKTLIITTKTHAAKTNKQKNPKKIPKIVPFAPLSPLTLMSIPDYSLLRFRDLSMPPKFDPNEYVQHQLPFQKRPKMSKNIPEFPKNIPKKHNPQNSNAKTSPLCSFSPHIPSYYSLPYHVIIISPVPIPLFPLIVNFPNPI